MKTWIKAAIVCTGLAGVSAVEPLINPTTTVTEEVTETIAYKTVRTYDDTLREGTIKAKQEGKNGSKQVTYTISRKGGKEIKREKNKEKITEEATTEELIIGTKEYFTCSNGKEFDNIKERDECEKRIAWEKQRDEAIAECKADSRKYNCWYDKYPGTTIHWTEYTYTNNNRNSGYRTGAICRDGWRSYSTGRGTCSHHGGVSYWLY
jgi:hypothetical protein